MTCDYLTRPSQHAELQRCGKPAEYQGTTGARLNYCADCAKIVRRSIKLQPAKVTAKLTEVQP